MLLVVGWEPLSGRVEFEPRLLSMVFSLGECPTSSLSGSCTQDEVERWIFRLDPSEG